MATSPESDDLTITATSMTVSLNGASVRLYLDDERDEECWIVADDPSKARVHCTFDQFERARWFAGQAVALLHADLAHRRHTEDALMALVNSLWQKEI